MKKPTLTVGIPAYNEEKNITRLVASIIAQKEDVSSISQVIIISDGSTDNTIKCLEKIKSSKLIVINGKKRLGQAERQNQIIKLMHKNDNYLLILEADTLPKSNTFISNMVKEAIKHPHFSVITCTKDVIESKTSFGKIMDFGFRFRFAIFEHAMNFPNLYLFNTGLISKGFLSKFKWETEYHDDSYLYRKSLLSGYPILHVRSSVLQHKSVDNLNDYLLQSGKFQKAKKNESKISGIYNQDYQLLAAIKIIFSYFLKNPFYFCIYLLILGFGRIYALFLPEYTKFWKIYKSTKNI